MTRFLVRISYSLTGVSLGELQVEKLSYIEEDLTVEIKTARQGGGVAYINN